MQILRLLNNIAYPFFEIGMSMKLGRPIVESIYLDPLRIGARRIFVFVLSIR